MTIYKNMSRRSNVIGYEIHTDSILVVFADYSEYEYKYEYAGISNVEMMKRLALAGSGLNSYINKYCKYLYSSKTYLPKTYRRY